MPAVKASSGKAVKESRMAGRLMKLARFTP
jgi:hypothetical protein